MPRDLVVGNQTLLVNIDRNLNIRDLYYPHVGLYNHVNGYKNRVGVWVDGQFSWLDDTWTIRFGYRPQTLTTDAYAENGRLGVALRVNDAVHPEWNLFIRQVSVENLCPEQREVRLFFSHDFRIQESDIGDTAFFHPFSGAMVHFKRDCYLLTNGRTTRGGISQYAAGVKEFGGAEGTWRDAEDGTLSMHPIEQGSVDSTISFDIEVPGNGSETIDYWIAAGRSLDEVVRLNDSVAAESVAVLLDECDDFWKNRLTKAICNDKPSTHKELASLYERSLLTIQTQIDRCGGILAANDTDIMRTARAHYSYVWPRDGALISYALDSAGFPEAPRKFFSFCAGILPEKRPYFLQKYSPDGNFGATWHSWIVDGEPEVPCQQDSTALVLWSIGKHFDRWKNREDAESVYHDLMVPAADYIVADLAGGQRLPSPSYDLWEERRGVHLWTCCTLFGALSAAIKLSMLLDKDKVMGYRKARTGLKKLILEKFFDVRLNRFVRSLTPNGDGYEPDLKIDSSMSALWLFDVLPADDPKVISTMHAIGDRLWVRSPVGGIARYEDDAYFRVSSDVANVPGNPWMIASLWMAEWYVAVARGLRDLEPASDLLAWVVKNASPAGLLPEQVHPYTGEPLAVMPLTWSHATYVLTYRKYEAKVRELSANKA